jgi:thymidylate synthase
MKQYLSALKQVLEQGTEHPDRTGTGTISLFGLQQRYDLRQGFPAVTTKRLAWRSVVSELLWFIEGSGDEKRLREILHGDRNSPKDTIWTANAQAPYWKPRAQFDGDLGRIYGVQWRNWNGIDQLATLINDIKTNPYSRRHILSAWNVSDLDHMALPPCHVLAQFSVRSVQDGRDELSCQMYQRSCDMFLGVPFNVASYSLLTHMIAQVCDLAVGEFVHVLGDAHIYLNHIEQVNEQLKREPLPAPQLWLNPEIKDIDKFTMADIKLLNYQSHDAIKAEMAV